MEILCENTSVKKNIKVCGDDFGLTVSAGGLVCEAIYEPDDSVALRQLMPRRSIALFVNRASGAFSQL